MGPTVVIAYSGFGDIEIEKEILRQIDATVIHTGNVTDEDTLKAVRQADALMVTIEPVSAELIDSMEQCRIISRVGTGLDAIDIPAATARNIWVTYVPDYSIDEVSTHAIALMLAQARGLIPLVDSTRKGVWDGTQSGVVERLSDQTLGVVGLVRIWPSNGSQRDWSGSDVIAFDPYVAPNIFASLNVRQVDLETLLRTSDFISLHSPLTDDTRHIINAKTLSQMKPNAYLINAARGPLIDEDALLRAVRSGQIKGAALDVLTVEPPAPDHPFLSEERILVTPHNAWYSEAAKIDVRTRGAEEVVRVLSGKPPRTPVNQL